MTTPIKGWPEQRRMEPLWDRVDRNRFRLLVYLALFALLSAIGFAACALALAFVLAVVGAMAGWGAAFMPLDALTSGGAGQVFARSFAVGVVMAALYEWWALSRSERWVVRRLGATLVPKGELYDTKMMLKDMAIAAGMKVAPALYTIDTDHVNAFVFGAPGRRPVLGITHGMHRRLALEEQRAVFANLVARLATGDSRVSSAVTAITSPLQTWREWRLAAIDADDEAFERALIASADMPEEQPVAPGFGLAGMLLVLAPWFVFGAVLLGEVAGAAHRRSQLTAAEKADAEGMLLLKDPQAMLSALEKCVRFDNFVPTAGEHLCELFYCWTGESTDDEDDPEWERVARLREVLGVEGAVLPAPAWDAGEAAVAPPAPRVVSEAKDPHV